MSAMAAPQRHVQTPRPSTTSRTRLQLVPTPSPARGFFGTVALCVVLFLGAFGAVFFMNTQMVATAFEIQQTQKQLNASLSEEATLKDQVVYASTPLGLAARAQQLGLVKATDVLYLDLETGATVVPSQTGN